jgi:hypothetical protein
MSGEEGTDYDFDYDDNPDLARFIDEASARLRQVFDAYANALGRFLLAYNQLDHQLEKVIGITLKQLGAPELPRMRFVDRVEYLDRLKITKAGQRIASIQTKGLIEINSERGRLAHAHFEESPNPVDDCYSLVSPRTGIELAERYQYDAAGIDGLTQRIHTLSQQLLAVEYAHTFDSVPLPVPR